MPFCKIPGCNNTVFIQVHALCSKHYAQERKKAKEAKKFAQRTEEKSEPPPKREFWQPDAPKFMKQGREGLFFCPRLACNLTPIGCATRMGLPPIMQGERDVSRESEKYCRSGECPIGEKIAGVVGLFLDIEQIARAERLLLQVNSDIKKGNSVRYAADQGVRLTPRRHLSTLSASLKMTTGK